MPISYYIDHKQCLVVAKGQGLITSSEVFNYQREVWSKPEVRDYNELFDMSEVEEIDLPGAVGSSMQQLASEAAAMDSPTLVTKFAIVATDQFAFGLSRMYQTYRELEKQSTKQVRIFHTLAEALSFLGIESLEQP